MKTHTLLAASFALCTLAPIGAAVAQSREMTPAERRAILRAQEQQIQRGSQGTFESPFQQGRQTQPANRSGNGNGTAVTPNR